MAEQEWSCSAITLFGSILMNQISRQPAPSGQANLLTEEAASNFLGVSRSFLAKARCRGDGPEYYTLGSAIRYSTKTLEAYLLQRRSRSTKEGRS
jgi:hypothetical protein